MLYGGVTIFSDRDNLAYVSSPTVLVAKLSETTTQRRMHWRTYPGQFRCEIMRIPGKDNCWLG